jgi:hypothetical protein
VLCLEVVGAKSGQVRRTPLLFTKLDGERMWAAARDLYRGFDV